MGFLGFLSHNEPSKPEFSVDTRYNSVPTSQDGVNQATEVEPFQEKQMELGDHKPLNSNRRVKTTIVIQFFCLAWLAPIVALLVLNMSTYVIGASAWCPDNKCFVDAYAYDTAVPENRIHRFDRQGHNLLGVLQLVAKALEVWFAVIAVMLVYLITMRLAGQKEGLPVSYLMRPVEFADPLSIFDPLLWTSLPTKHTPGFRKPWARYRVYVFILLTCFLCVLANLMGPATAVLVIPSLQWINTDKIGNQTFSNLNSGNPPTADGFVWGDTFNCAQDQVAAHEYSCTTYDWAEKLDSWMMSTATSQAEGSNTVAQQDRLFFQVNNTQPTADGNYTAGYLLWVPSRQLISTFSADSSNIMYVAQGYNASGIGLSDEEFASYVPYNKSLQLQLQRNGPVIGTYPTTWWTTGQDWDIHPWTTTVDENRALQCFPGYGYAYQYAYPGYTTNYTRCIQDGAGWGSNTKYASFTIEGSNSTTSGLYSPEIKVEVFSSDKIAFLRNTTEDGDLAYPSGITADCLPNGQIPAGTDCDWDSFFTANPQHAEPDGALHHRSVHL